MVATWARRWGRRREGSRCLKTRRGIGKVWLRPAAVGLSLPFGIMKGLVLRMNIPNSSRLASRKMLGAQGFFKIKPHFFPLVFRLSPRRLPRLNKSWGRAAGVGDGGAALGSQKQPGAAKSSPGSHEQPGAAQEQPGAVLH